MIRLTLGLVLSAAIGASLGLLGGGGSIITLPVLVYVLGVDVYQAVGMSLAVVGATSLVGAALHGQRGRVSLKVGAVFGVFGAIGAMIGARLTHLLSPSALLLAFASLMLVVSVLMLTRESNAEAMAGPPRFNPVKAAAAGALVGALTGFLGVGGGFLVVPALIFFAGLTIRESIGTSLLVIAINSFAGLVGHLERERFDLRLTALVTLCAVGGALIGSALSHRISPRGLRKSFAVFVLAVALLLVAENYAVLFR
ncbi:MAG: sulfite exporter TauE/SafE family protein [Pyrinomonas sp.]